jgi:sporulation-control protein
MSVFKGVRAFVDGSVPSVVLTLATPVVHPGEDVRGCVHLRGGQEDVLIGRVAVGLAAEGPRELTQADRREHDLSPTWRDVLGRVVARQDAWLPAGQRLDVPFTLALPWTAPATAVGTAVLPVTAEVWTELVVHDARDESTRRPLVIQPLPSQNRVLDAFGQLGATFATGDVLRARVPGVAAGTAVLEFTPPLRYAQLVEVGVAFVADPGNLRVIVTAKKYRSWLQPDSVVVGDFHLPHEDVWRVDWAAAIDRCMAYAVR